jgi:3,4-dihydroxy 2-butanone 4-phosphate synthase
LAYGDSLDPIDDAVSEMRKGKVVIIYDGDDREGEADMVLSARFAEPAAIERMRKDAGGLICAALGSGKAAEIGLPFFTDLLEASDATLKAISCRKTAYGDKPAFSIPVNHCEVFTGITDNDRSLTMKKLDEVVRTRPGDFRREFYSPGHVFLLIGRGIDKRRGHTELSLEMGRRAGMDGVMVLCEMLGSGKALTKQEAAAYARRHGLAFVEGKDIISAGKGAGA